MLLKEMALSKVVIYLNALSYYSSVFWSNWSNEVCTRKAFKYLSRFERTCFNLLVISNSALFSVFDSSLDCSFGLLGGFL